MPVFEDTVFIARPPRDVFDFIIESGNLAVWDTSVVTAVKVGTGPVGLGTRTRGTSRIMGKQLEWVTETTEFGPPSRVTYASVEGQISFVVTNILEPVDGGTRLTYRVDTGSGLGGVFGRLAEPFIEKAQNRTLRANLEALAQLLLERSHI
ncbi:MAG: SRPBCC family protein [Dermatophilaceae bacterium]